MNDKPFIEGWEVKEGQDTKGFDLSYGVTKPNPERGYIHPFTVLEYLRNGDVYPHDEPAFETVRYFGEL